MSRKRSTSFKPALLIGCSAGRATSVLRSPARAGGQKRIETARDDKDVTMRPKADKHERIINADTFLALLLPWTCNSSGLDSPVLLTGARSAFKRFGKPSFEEVKTVPHPAHLAA